MCTNEVVANLALELVGLPKGDYAAINPNDHVNKSQSTNDAYPTGFRLAVHMLVDDLVAEVKSSRRRSPTRRRVRRRAQDGPHAAPGRGPDDPGPGVPRLRHQHRRGGPAPRERRGPVARGQPLGATAIGTGLNTPTATPGVASRKLSEVSGYTIISAPDLIEATHDNGAYIAVHLR